MRLIVLALVTVAATPLTAQDAAEGAALFQHYCATCHGVAAQGDGPMAGALMIPPPDLTGLAARNDGIFPVTRIVTRIDGRDPLVSHGSAMPVYGDFFEGDDMAVQSESGQPIMTSRPIIDVLEWLRSVQG